MPVERRIFHFPVSKKRRAELETLRNTQISFDDFVLNYAGKNMRPEKIPGIIHIEGFLGTKAAEMAKRYASDHKISYTETVTRGVSALKAVVAIQKRDEIVVVLNPGEKERIFDLPRVEAIDPAESTSTGLSIYITPKTALFLYNYSQKTSAPVNDIINMSVLALDDIARGSEFYAAAKLRSMKFNF